MTIRATRGQVPHFSMRPHPAIVITMILTLIIGVLLAFSFFSQEEGSGAFRQRGILTLVITAIFCFFLTIAATAKFWHPHLWKKNSTHARHRQHTKYHPAMRDKKFREQHRNTNR